MVGLGREEMHARQCHKLLECFDGELTCQEQPLHPQGLFLFSHLISQGSLGDFCLHISQMKKLKLRKLNSSVTKIV